MKTALIGIILVLCLCGGARAAGLSFGTIMMERASAIPYRGLFEGVEPMEMAAVSTDTASAPADTTNKALNNMLAQFIQNPESKELSYTSWTMTVHRILGIAIVAGAGVQAILGAITYNKEKNGNVADTANVHKYLGYTVAGLSVVQTSFGYYNFYQLRDRETGKTKRWVHLTLSTLATAGFIAAAAIAHNSRSEIQSGQAGLEGKTFGDLYNTHAAVGTLATVSVMLTAVVIIW
jgi:hypothetical protein